MLITNFASGELSEDLFGRIDLPQYYQGAARIENFDILPAGGIEKRPGTRRVLQGLESGRIIPFVASREESYILHLANEKITIWRAGQWKKPVEIFGNSDIADGGNAEPPTLYKADEIPDVQHAQNFRMMLLVHKNHKPLQISFYENNISISVFNITSSIQFVCPPGVEEAFTREDSDAGKDEAYADGYLTKEGHYPGCVTFFNQRLVFASTHNDGQRLFFSRVGKYNDFSTCRAYVRETKAYAAIRGSIEGNGKAEIRLENADEAKMAVAGNAENYFIDSPIFDPGTRLIGGPYQKGDSHYWATSGPSKNMLGQTQEEIRGSLEKKALELADQLTDTITTFCYVNKPAFPKYLIYHLHLHMGLHSYSVSYNEYEKTASSVRGPYYIPSNAAGLFSEGSPDGGLYAIIIATCRSIVSSWGSKYEFFEKADAKQNFISAISRPRGWKDRIKNYMSFEYGGATYYDYPTELRAKILSMLEAENAAIPLYTLSQEYDKYPSADDGFTFELASDRNDAIRWLVQNKNLIAGTESAEYVMPSNITAISISAGLNSFHGSSKLQAASAGDAVVFFRSGNKGLAEYYVPQADNHFRANDLAMLARQMLHDSEAADFDIAASPYTKILVARKDGNIAVLLYDRTMGVFAWSRHLQEGSIKSLAVVPGGSGYDDVYLLAGYGGRCCLELLESGGNVYLDSWQEWAFDSPAGRASLLSQYANNAVVYDAAGHKSYRLADTPTEGLPESSAAGSLLFIGYPYKSVMRTMPAVNNDKMDKQRIASLSFRFLKSSLPLINSVAGGKIIKTETITNTKDPRCFSGVHKIPYPGTWDKEVQIELFHEQPEPLKILAVYAEVQ